MTSPMDSNLRCSHCGHSTDRIYRTYLGIAYGGCCYFKCFTPSTCTRCGRACKILTSESPHECPTCLRHIRWDGKPCARCGRAIRKLGVESNDGRLPRSSAPSAARAASACRRCAPPRSSPTAPVGSTPPTSSRAWPASPSSWSTRTSRRATSSSSTPARPSSSTSASPRSATPPTPIWSRARLGTWRPSCSNDTAPIAGPTCSRWASSCGSR